MATWHVRRTVSKTKTCVQWLERLWLWPLDPWDCVWLACAVVIPEQRASCFFNQIINLFLFFLSFASHLRIKKQWGNFFFFLFKPVFTSCKSWECHTQTLYTVYGCTVSSQSLQAPTSLFFLLDVTIHWSKVQIVKVLNSGWWDSSHAFPVAWNVGKTSWLVVAFLWFVLLSVMHGSLCFFFSLCLRVFLEALSLFHSLVPGIGYFNSGYFPLCYNTVIQGQLTKSH